ncbi:2OG-Fe(II) oxygenase [Simiduia curdlanivorans]|uniref:2OG-Fe(II) oxygenase n=1 Tax=Simiduia curdlanivorans TaxID=1492769 RepID=A0ABV8V9E4_9GAMM|nr:2OG-Fe(II) oxygenase [Simiduia curdlanivorans]MDN3639374.1 2OG-Fe(II) oxygenase [Simiduia curdlanivorans]
MAKFIQEFSQALSAEACQHLIDKFEASGQARAGQTGQGVDLSKKHSLDLVLNEQADWQPELNSLQQITYQGLLHYVKRFPSIIAGAVSPTVLDPVTQQPSQITHANIAQFDDQLLLNVIRSIYRLGHINLQKYPSGEGGYHHWHSEIYPHPTDPQQESLHRALVFMYYLNDVAEGGETAFIYQNIKLKPKAGNLVLFPGGFTHTHKGAIPQSGDKYILTSWVLFRAAEDLYGK